MLGRGIHTVAALAAVMVVGAVPASTAANAAPVGHHGGTVTVPLVTFGTDTYAKAINGRGDILGTVYESEPPFHGRDGVWFRYDEFTPLGPGEVSGIAINNLGHVAGGGPVPSESLIWRDGEITVLANPAGWVAATDINDRDQVAGDIYTDLDGVRAFLWDRGTFTMLPSPADTHSFALAVNNRGQVIGQIVGRYDPGWAGFVLWDRGRMIYLGTLGGPTLWPAAINDRGQIVGTSETADGRTHPFLWNHGRMIDLVAGTNIDHGEAWAINDSGVIVGTADGRPVAWHDGRMRYLTPPGYVGTDIFVNRGGDIAGTLFPAGDVEMIHGRVFLWRGDTVTYIDAPAGAAGVRANGMDDRGRMVGMIDLGEGGGQQGPVVWIVG